MLIALIFTCVVALCTLPSRTTIQATVPRKDILSEASEYPPADSLLNYARLNTQALFSKTSLKRRWRQEPPQPSGRVQLRCRQLSLEILFNPPNLHGGTRTMKLIHECRNHFDPIVIKEHTVNNLTKSTRAALRREA